VKVRRNKRRKDGKMEGMGKKYVKKKKGGR
jgi:hypothetical protein